MLKEFTQQKEILKKCLDQEIEKQLIKKISEEYITPKQDLQVNQEIREERKEYEDAPINQPQRFPIAQVLNPELELQHINQIKINLNELLKSDVPPQLGNVNFAIALLMEPFQFEEAHLKNIEKMSVNFKYFSDTNKIEI